MVTLPAPHSSPPSRATFFSAAQSACLFTFTNPIHYRMFRSAGHHELIIIKPREGSMKNYLVEFIGTLFLVGNFAGAALAAFVYKTANPEEYKN
jgi:hypothetical protein